MRHWIWSALAGAILIGLPMAAHADTPQHSAPWQLGLHDPVTPVMRQMTDFHNLLLVIITGITLFVMALLGYVMWRYRADRNPEPTTTTHNTFIEVVWTVVPVLILVIIAVPSFRLLYFSERIPEPEVTVQVAGYQWFWGYAFPDQQIEEYTSFVLDEDELGPDQLRLLSVDNPLVLPVDTNIEFQITAGDVLHAFAVPSFGVKMDAIPGRSNATWARIEQEGTYYGQCSQICGEGHFYMPIEIRAVSREAFDAWVLQQTAGLPLETPPKLLTRSFEDHKRGSDLADAAEGPTAAAGAN